VTAALILFEIYLWQRMSLPSFGYVPTVNGQRGAYRSLSEIQEKFPWLTEEAIRKAINRAEKALKGAFIVDRDNPNAERGKLHFWLCPRRATKYKFDRYGDEKKGMLALRQDDAVAYGVIGAVLISNLLFATDEDHNTAPLRDDEGHIYRELSPTKLTETIIDKNGGETTILPFSRKAVSGVLTELKNDRGLFEHPSRSGFYRVNPDRHAVTKVADGVTKVASAVTKVAGRIEVSASNTLSMNGLCHISETSDTNPDTNPDTKCLLTPTAPLRCAVAVPSFNLSPSAKSLLENVTRDMEEFRQKQKLCPPPENVPQRSINEYLLYDFIAFDPHTGKLYFRKKEIDSDIDSIKTELKCFGMKYTRKDLNDLRHVFEEHLHFKHEHFSELLGMVQPHAKWIVAGKLTAPKEGFDAHRCGRRIRTLGQMLRYLPQLTREHFIYWQSVLSSVNDFGQDKRGKHRFDYSEMREPYFSLAFRDETVTPVTFIDAEEYDSETCPNPTKRPVFYPEFVGLPVVEEARYEANPIAEEADLSCSAPQGLP
jgi:hypothetical protein